MRKTPPLFFQIPPLLLAVALGLALLAAYATSLGGGFLWDDDLHITANPTIIGPLGLKEIWTSARANYFPLVLTNFWVQHALWGLEPIGYRIVTLGFHFGAALLLWRVLSQLRIPGAWLGASLWALHPVQVESVAWICELKNTQSAVFFLASIACFVRWLEVRRGTLDGDAIRLVRPEETRMRHVGGRFWYGLALIGAVLAILSKPSTVMLPVALGLCAWWVQRRIAWRDALALAPFFALSAVAAGWTIWEQKFHSGAIGPEWSQSLPERIAIAGRVIWFYLGKLAWPEPLIFIYTRWSIDPRNVWSYVAVLTAGAGMLLLWLRREQGARPVWFAAAYFVALLFPVLGFFSVYFFRYSFVGDHFQYLASMGPLALAGAGIATLGRRAAAIVSTAVLLACGVLTAHQARSYVSNEALWRDTVTHNPAAVMAWLNLGDTHAQAARYDEAIGAFRRALEIRPADPEGLNDLGNVLVLVGRAEEALAHFEKALILEPDFADARSNYGNALRGVGRADEAIAQYRRALELKPNHTGALNNLGAELAQRGQANEALALFERALRLNPADAATHDNLGSALRELGRYDEAIARHQEALRLKPDFAEARANLARALLRAGRQPDAFAEFERALQLKPALWAARSHYAAALRRAGRSQEALAQLERAVALSPEAVEPLLNLGTALGQAGQPEDALRHFTAAVRLAPNFAAAHTNVANALLALGRWAEAIQSLNTALRLQPDSAVTHAQLAVAHVNNGDLAAAVPHFEAALRLNPNAADVHENFSQVLNALGRKREALEHFEAAARIRSERRSEASPVNPPR